MFPFTLVCYSERCSLCFFMELASRTKYLSPAWMKNPLQMGYLRTESQASGLKMNVHLILNTTFLIVARKVKNPPLEFQFCIGSGTLVEAANLAADSPTSKMGA